MIDEQERHPRSPSRCNGLAQCPGFRGRAEVGEAAARGTGIHEAVAADVLGHPYQAPAEDADAILWAAGQVRSLMESETIRVEHFLRIFADYEEFGPEMTCGTVDYSDRHGILDLKTGQPRDYAPQLNLYALGWMQETGARNCVVRAVYVDSRRVEVRELTYAEAVVYATALWRDIASEERRPCEYCSWCAEIETCPALVDRATAAVQWQEVAAKRAEELDTPAARGAMLDLVEAVERWAKAMRSSLRRTWLDGAEVAGRKRQTARSVRVIDPTLAYQRCRITAEAFMACCEVQIGKLREAFAAANAGIIDLDTGRPATKKALMGSVMENLLGGAIEISEEVRMVKDRKGKEDEDA